MPELPEVETIKRDLEKLILGKKITGVEIVPDPKFRALRRYPSSEIFVQEVKNTTIKGINRRAKYLLLSLDSGDNLIIHLGMTGQLLYRPSKTQRENFTRVVFLLNDYELRFTDVRKLGELYLFSPGKQEELDLSKLGPEPLENEFTPEYLTRMLKKRKKAIKQVLMDQNIIAGIGNIYSDEVLFEARINPKRPASSLGPKEIASLYQATRKVLQEAIDSRGTTAENEVYVDAFGREGNFQNKLKVYQRTERPCYVCGRPISRTEFGGRSCHFCSRCQK